MGGDAAEHRRHGKAARDGEIGARAAPARCQCARPRPAPACGCVARGGAAVDGRRHVGAGERDARRAALDRESAAGERHFKRALVAGDCRPAGWRPPARTDRARPKAARRSRASRRARHPASVVSGPGARMRSAALTAPAPRRSRRLRARLERGPGIDAGRAGTGPGRPAPAGTARRGARSNRRTGVRPMSCQPLGAATELITVCTPAIETVPDGNYARGSAWRGDRQRRIELAEIGEARLEPDHEDAVVARRVTRDHIRLARSTASPRPAARSMPSAPP